MTYGCGMNGTVSSRITPRERASQLVAEAPDLQWVRRLVDDLDRRLRSAPLERLLALWDVSASEAASMFGVSRQAFSKWRRTGPPPDRAPAIAAMATATNLLDRHVSRERIAAVVRRPAAMLDGQSLYDWAMAGRYDDVARTVETMFDLRRVQP